MAQLNIVIATTQRPTLIRMLLSLKNQLSPTDCITVLNDSGKPFEYKRFGLNGFRCQHEVIDSNGLGYWGHEARNQAQNHLFGQYLMHADDDDKYRPDAIATVKADIARHPGKLLLYRFHNHRNNTVYWQEHRKGEFASNIGTPCGVIPNKPPFPDWGLFYGGDGSFYQELSQRFEPVWINKIIYDSY
jgi:hypothetical protein